MFGDKEEHVQLVFLLKMKMRLIERLNCFCWRLGKKETSREKENVMYNAYFHGFIFSQSNQLLPLLYSNPKEPKSPRIKIIGGLVSSSDWNEVWMEEAQILAVFSPQVLA